MTDKTQWPAMPDHFPRKYHKLFGWGRCYPTRAGERGTLFHPEMAVEWNTSAPPFRSKRDRVEVNEPIRIPIDELRDTDTPEPNDSLYRIALDVNRIPPSRP